MAHGKLLFSVAGRELCALKANETSAGSIQLVPDQYYLLKQASVTRPRASRQPEIQNAESTSPETEYEEWSGFSSEESDGE